MTAILKDLAKRAINPPYSGDALLAIRIAGGAMSDFHKAATPKAVLILLDEIERLKARPMPDVLARVYFHDLPDENDYEVHDEKHMSGDCDGCIPAYIVSRANFDTPTKCTTCNDTGCVPRTDDDELHPCVDCAAKPPEQPAKKKTDEELLQSYKAERERELSIIRDNSADISLRQVAMAMLHVYDQSIHRLKQKLEFKRIKEHSPLMTALVQYRNTHNDELVFGFDIAETERVFSEQIANLVKALERFLDNPTPRSEDFYEARSAIFLAAFHKQGGDA